jgi:hypothetical protein
MFESTILGEDDNDMSKPKYCSKCKGFYRTATCPKCQKKEDTAKKPLTEKYLLGEDVDKCKECGAEGEIDHNELCKECQAKLKGKVNECSCGGHKLSEWKEAGVTSPESEGKRERAQEQLKKLKDSLAWLKQQSSKLDTPEKKAKNQEHIKRMEKAITDHTKTH